MSAADHGAMVTTHQGCERWAVRCWCGWLTPTVADKRTAEQAISAHVEEPES